MNRNRLMLVAAAVGGAALLAVVLILVVGKSSTATTTTATAPAIATAAKLFAGIPQHGNTIGKASAPATLIVYEDPQCPFCREWNVQTLPTVLDQYVRTGKLKLVYRGVVIIGPDSVRGLRAIGAAAKQNKLWNLVDALYARQGAENSGWITNSVIVAAASDAGANGPAVVAGMGAPSVGATLTTWQSQAKADRLQGTPTFVIERPPAVSQQLPVQGLDPATFVAALAAALQ
ncbi:MAG TPA: thioredoxin domain-containing protein [Gaiellaceae bacterium]|nr:thioredoxin domain-containing protein [Gaiellaceae bacterium]